MSNRLICIKNNDNKFVWILKCRLYFLYISHLLNNSISGFYIFISFGFLNFWIFHFSLEFPSQLYVLSRVITHQNQISIKLSFHSAVHKCYIYCVNITHPSPPAPTSNFKQGRISKEGKRKFPGLYTL